MLSPASAVYPLIIHSAVHNLGDYAASRGAPGGKADRHRRLTVASLNLHCGLGWRGEPYDVAAAIRGLDAAVICLQEAWLPKADEAAIGAGSGGLGGPADAIAEAARSLGAPCTGCRSAQA